MLLPVRHNIVTMNTAERFACTDAHCHLADPRLRGSLEHCLHRAGQAGVSCMICCATSPHDWDRVAQIAREHACSIPSFGLHPWFVATAAKGWFEQLVPLLERYPHSGVGEIGLDWMVEPCDREAQVHAFELQLDCARQMDRPVSIHCRGAWGALLASLKRAGVGERSGIVHSWSGSTECAREVQRAGLSLSFSASCLRPQAHRVREVLRTLDPWYLLVETDSPDQPLAFNTGVNEPAFLTRIVAGVAAVRAQEFSQVAAAAHAAAQRIFCCG